MPKAIDAHIHLDLYSESDAERMLSSLPTMSVHGLIAVSMNLASSMKTQSLHRLYTDRVYPAYGFHPEQDVPSLEELDRLLDWIQRYHDDMIAIGEVGLPYYRRQEAENRGEAFDMRPYLDLLERFVQLSATLEKPIVLHAVYEDAELACDLLKKYNVTRAHFHWFKGSGKTAGRMKREGYFISITPDVWYEKEIQELVAHYPLELMMVETDGPWPFEGPFAGHQTHPGMIHEVIRTIGRIRSIPYEQAADIIYRNTRQFYRLDIK